MGSPAKRPEAGHQWECISYCDMRRNIDRWPVCAMCGMLQRIDRRKFPCLPTPQRSKASKKGGPRV